MSANNKPLTLTNNTSLRSIVLHHEGETKVELHLNNGTVVEGFIIGTLTDAIMLTSDAKNGGGYRVIPMHALSMLRVL